MRLTAALLPLLAASVASSSLFGSSSQNTLVDDEKFTVPGKNPLDFCADPKDYIITVDYVDLDPNPPNPGDKLKITANGTLSEDVEPGATVFLQVKYGLITLIKQEADLCDNLGKINMSCPLKKGPMTIKQEVNIPKAVVCQSLWLIRNNADQRSPPGKYTVLADVNTVDKEKVTCMEATVFFSK